MSNPEPETRALGGHKAEAFAPTCKQCNALSMCERCGREKQTGAHVVGACRAEFGDLGGRLECGELTIARLTADRDKWRAAWQSELAANDRMSAEIAARDERIGRLRNALDGVLLDTSTPTGAELPLSRAARARVRKALADDAAAGGKETSPPELAGKLTDEERHIMEHATAWRHPRNPRYRNYYVAGPDQDSWAALQGLCASGLMQEGKARIAGRRSMSTFSVTAAGIAALERVEPSKEKGRDHE